MLPKNLRQIPVSYKRDEVSHAFGMIHLNIHPNFEFYRVERESNDCRVFGEIEIPFKGKIIHGIEINLYNPFYNGYASAACSTIPGVISQNKGNLNTLLNLYLAISESLLIRSEFNLNLVDYDFVLNDSFDELPIDLFQRNPLEIIEDLGCNKIYMGHYHYLCSSDENSSLIYTIPKGGFHYEKSGNGLKPYFIEGTTPQFNLFSEFLMERMVS